MRLESLQLSGVRNLAEVQLGCCPNINIIIGNNAAGKTAILEGIHLLSKATSFRTPRVRDIIHYGQDRLCITARLQTAGSTVISTGYEKSREQTIVKYNGEKVKRRSEQARNLPIVTLTTESHRLVYGTPRERRHWLDWSLFHVEHGYMEIWHDYHNALRNRNSLLRNKARNEEFLPWEQQLAKSAVRLRTLRNGYLQDLGEQLQSAEDAELSNIRITLQSQEEDEATLKQRYQQRDTDIAAGHTQTGAHREDIIFRSTGRHLGKTYSRGEAKWFVFHLMLAQARHYRDKCDTGPLLLIDDLAAEMDEARRDAMLSLIEEQDMQVFMTATHASLLPIRKAPWRLFHVEHGRIIKVVE